MAGLGSRDARPGSRDAGLRAQGGGAGGRPGGGGRCAGIVFVRGHRIGVGENRVADDRRGDTGILEAPHHPGGDGLAAERAGVVARLQQRGTDSAAHRMVAGVERRLPGGLQTNHAEAIVIVAAGHR
jgi:hypothetical protein